MQIILASASPRREIVLKNLGWDFRVIPSNFDERSIEKADPTKLVEILALEKARTVTKANPDALVIGADTVMEIAGEVVGKPKDLSDARRMLHAASGKVIKDFTGIAALYQGKEKSASLVGSAFIKRFGDAEIDDYFSRVNPLDKAGALAGASAEGGEFLEKYVGEPGQELGLPTTTLRRFIQEFGLKI